MEVQLDANLRVLYFVRVCMSELTHRRIIVHVVHVCKFVTSPLAVAKHSSGWNWFS